MTDPRPDAIRLEGTHSVDITRMLDTAYVGEHTTGTNGADDATDRRHGPVCTVAAGASQSSASPHSTCSRGNVRVQAMTAAR